VWYHPNAIPPNTGVRRGSQKPRHDIVVLGARQQHLCKRQRSLAVGESSRSIFRPPLNSGCSPEKIARQSGLLFFAWLAGSSIWPIDTTNSEIMNGLPSSRRVGGAAFAAGIKAEKKSPLFRSTRGKSGELRWRALSRVDVFRMIQRRANDTSDQAALSATPFTPECRAQWAQQ
jgi:hypothetical protein